VSLPLPDLKNLFKRKEKKKKKNQKEKEKKRKCLTRFCFFG
tara:strand:+ start:176 stop:298 length:123 start_codon:yes stop_codon:yes gene_type:complete